MTNTAATLYTDGGASPNPGPGGWGVVILDQTGSVQQELSGGEPESTNNRMELTAAIRGLESQPAGSKVVLYTDSTYVRSGITQWINSWVRKNWMRGPKANEPVKNADLWKLLHRLDTEREVDWRWLKGHAGDEYNERADQLATEAILAQRGGPASTAATDSENDAFEEADTQAVIKVRSARGQSQWLVLMMDESQQAQLDGTEDGAAPRGELRAGLEVLRTTDRSRSLGIRCGDYFKRGCLEWLPAWKSRGWTTAGGDPVKNKDLWKLVDQELVDRTIHFAPLPKKGPLASELRRRLKEL